MGRSCNYAVIMAGGSGTRFWPLSTPEIPKQFQKIADSKKTMIQQTIERISPLFKPENILIVTGKKFKSLAQAQLPKIPSENIILEPEGRNTAPCVALAAFILKQRKIDTKATMTLLPSDHVIGKEKLFIKILEKAIDAAQTSSKLFTLGIVPDKPETGYGYIEIDGDIKKLETYKVKRFVEKPTLLKAEEFLKSEKFLWNAGMFIWRVDSILDELSKYTPSLYKLLAPIQNLGNVTKIRTYIEKHFAKCEKISIDYAIMEKTENAYCLPSDIGWSDIGSWASFLEIAQKEDGSVVRSTKKYLKDTHNCMIHMPTKKVALIGLKDLIVVENNNYILICPANRSQDVREASEFFAKKD